MSPARKIAIKLVQQGVWDTPLESMPLAVGYLKAMILDDPRLRERVEIDISNFRGGITHSEMAASLFGKEIPDVLAFSVLGWNVRAFGALAATFKQLNPQGWIVFGGNHVSGQADRFLNEYPDVDIIVNGEGEITFRELVRAMVSGTIRESIRIIDGVSWRARDGAIITNEERARITDLDIIPSPFLTGALELTDEKGRFRYDVALIETNRGCPYKCSYCYWGGAVGQRVRSFSRARLRAELELFATLGVHTIVACDANFGMLPIDLELIDDLIAIKNERGFPKSFEASWAKNKSKTFYEIVRKMKESGLQSSFTLALQTLNPTALKSMNRKNMKLNDWRSLVDWLNSEGLDCYAELIWGAPGETVESFVQGYDELAAHVSRVAVYPLLLMPNTEYSERREQHGFVTVRGDHDDFEYVLAHHTMTLADNMRIQRFLFWARVLAENAVLRHSWLPLRQVAGWRQSQVLNSLADWVDTTGHPQAGPLRAAVARAHGGGAPAYAAAIGYLFTDPRGREALELWWRESVRPLLEPGHRPFMDEVFRYDLLTQPICPQSPEHEHPLRVARIAGEEFYVRERTLLRYDIPAQLATMRGGRPPDLRPTMTCIDLYYRTGALNAVRSTNHEEIVHFMGVPREMIDTARANHSEEIAYSVNIETVSAEPVRG